MVHETPEDLNALQRLLDASYASAGEHLQEVVTAERRLDAVGVVAALAGMRLLTLATITADGRPFRHISRRSAVSATHLPGEELAVSVHGLATMIDVQAPEHAGFRRTLLDIYTPRYGAEWENFLDAGAVYARINAAKMLTFSMPTGEL
jgi:hypothetical protein